MQRQQRAILLAPAQTRGGERKGRWTAEGKKFHRARHDARSNRRRRKRTDRRRPARRSARRVAPTIAQSPRSSGDGQSQLRRFGLANQREMARAADDQRRVIDRARAPRATAPAVLANADDRQPARHLWRLPRGVNPRARRRRADSARAARADNHERRHVDKREDRPRRAGDDDVLLGAPDGFRENDEGLRREHAAAATQRRRECAAAARARRDCKAR